MFFHQFLYKIHVYVRHTYVNHRIKTIGMLFNEFPTACAISRHRAEAPAKPNPS